VKTVYTRSWQTPDDVEDDTISVLVQVTIARNGNVLSHKVLKGSGNASLDASVNLVLDRVTFVGPFPAGAKEDQRSFKLNFNLKAKKLAG
jgi:TonB family protein